MIRPSCSDSILSFQERDEKTRGVILRQASNRRGLYHLMNETINPGILSKCRRHTRNEGFVKEYI